MRRESMRLRSVLLTASVLAAAPIAANAQAVDGLYVGAGAGFNYRQDQKIDYFQPAFPGVTGPISTFPTHGKVRTDGGFVGLASIGYGLGNGLRFEIEGNYRQNEVSRVTGTSWPTSSGGTIQTYGVMANALYDFDFGWPVVPYIGVGA